MNAPIRILVVEDEVILAEDLSETLNRQSYTVVDTADNAADAFDRASELKPDLIMMDIHLRGSDDGISAAARVRDELNIPVVFLTAHSDAATLNRAKQTSPYGYLVKPFNDQELRATIETALYRHQADAQLRHMERWLRTTLYSIGDAVITVDNNLRVTFINPMAECITGWSRQGALGRPYQQVFKLLDDQGSAITNPIEPVIECGETLHFDEDYSIETENGKLVRIDDSIAPIRDEEGTIAGAIIIFRDRTEKWELEQRRKEAEEKLQEAKRLESLGILAAGIAHDFNNLLAIIHGQAELLTDAVRDNEDDSHSINEILEATRRAAHLCEQMLSYGDAGKIVRHPSDIAAVIERTEKLIRVRLPSTVRVVSKFAEDTPPAFAHEGRIQQLLTNLLLNAVEAFDDDHGVVEISTGAVAVLPEKLRVSPPPDTAAGPWVAIRIRDSGSGMDEATLERLFDPFFTTKFTGRGLGMSVVFSVLQSHEAALAVESTTGHGTLFSVFLPVSAAQAEPTITAPANWKPEEPKRALILDDEKNVRVVLEQHLSRMGYACTDTDSPEDAISEIMNASGEFSVAVIDLTMPEVTGIEVLGRLRLIRKDLPVILISGFSADSISEIISTDENTLFVQKPFSRDDIKSALMRLKQ